MNKKRIVILVIGIIISISTIYYNYLKDKNDILFDNSIRIALSRTGAFGNTYYFVLTPDRCLKSYYGKRNWNNRNKRPFQNNFLSSIVKEDEIQLTTIQYESLLNLLNQLKESAKMSNKMIMLDGFDILVYYDETTYELYYYDYDLFSTEELINKISEYSNLKIDFEALYNYH